MVLDSGDGVGRWSLPPPAASGEARLAPPARGRIGRSAVALAALAHLLLLAWLIIDWHGPALDLPQPIPVQLVMAPPPPPPSPPRAKQPPPPPKVRESGPDQKTTAPPTATTTGPVAAPPSKQSVAAPTPTPAPAPAPAVAPTPAASKQPVPEAPAPPLPETKPAAPAPPREELRRPQEARLPSAPHPARALRDRVMGDRAETGDPYLNRLWSLILARRPATTPVGPAGLHLEGVTVFQMMLDREGHIEALRLAQSSGAPALDQEAERMVETAAPFPPPPSGYPVPLVINVVLHLSPGM